MTNRFEGLSRGQGQYDHLIVHVTATRPSMAEVDATWVDRVHRSKGWSGGGYNAIITRASTLQDEVAGADYRTRRYGSVGAHVGRCGPGWNARSIGIALAGGVAEADGETPENNMTDGQLDALWGYIKDAVEHFSIPWDNVLGHRDLIQMTDAPPKACPCFDVVPWVSTRRASPASLERESIGWIRAIFAQPTKQDRILQVPKVYTLREGDTLWSVSQTYGQTVQRLLELNPGLDPEALPVGSSIRLRH